MSKRTGRPPKPLTEYKVVRRVGGLYGEDSTVWHAVEVPVGVDGMKVRAFCSVQPAMYWSREQGEKVTCARCLKILNQRAEKALKREIF